MESMSFYVTKLPEDFPVILGLAWLKRHNPMVDWTAGKTTPCSAYCKKYCLSPGTLATKATPKWTTISRNSRNKPNILGVDATAYIVNVKAKGSTCFCASLNNINKALAEFDRVPTDPLPLLPDRLKDFANVFSKSESDKLPPHRPYDHEIPLEPSTTPPISGLYLMTREELLVLKRSLEDWLKRGCIRSSSSSAAAPVLFIHKEGSGGLRLCNNYRGINAITKKNRYALPLVRDTVNQMAWAKYFSKVDIIAAFNKLRIKEGEKWKTAFCTCYSLFKFW